MVERWQAYFVSQILHSPFATFANRRAVGVELLSFLITGLLGWGLWKLLIWWLEKEKAESEANKGGHREGNGVVNRPAKPENGNAANGAAGNARNDLFRRLFARKRDANADEETAKVKG
jgi:hypothetical protein